MRRTGQWHRLQSMGRRFSIGCVALEVTQRCNLDCTLCYLSDHSESVRDLPLAELFRRIDLIRAEYGPDTDVQITGGDPTLRAPDELEAIVARVSRAGMRPTLMTNGIRATRALLARLAGAGLVDVAFHVDLTQRRRGYADEAALDAVRLEYIERARGLGLAVMFNTTVFDGNLAQIPALVGFFVRHAADVRLASFQLQAATGRGTAGAAATPITIATVSAAIRAGTGADLRLALPVGHEGCNRYAMTAVANGRVHDLYDDDDALARLLDATAGTAFDRRHPARAVAAFARALLVRPRTLAALLPWAGRKLWAMRRDLVAARGRVHKLSFFIHDFMDAACLDCDRIEACVFTVATADGPVSMCAHNADRDAYVLRPVATADGEWDPLGGGTRAAPPDARRLKGRLKAARDAEAAAPPA